MQAVGQFNGYHFGGQCLAAAFHSGKQHAEIVPFAALEGGDDALYDGLVPAVDLACRLEIFYLPEVELPCLCIQLQQVGAAGELGRDCQRA